ncbi:hypothetical protein Ais01nite_74300 [Asanoa ishikariensis]|nr:hypothetical protein Ais01nite_74300 [Asanoa ishikariensis]
MSASGLRITHGNPSSRTRVLIACRLCEDEEGPTASYCPASKAVVTPDALARYGRGRGALALE